FLVFFQAEDGIRDRNVTGVQTCALPILAFAMYPDVLILDEPTTGLDVSTQSVVLDTIRQMTVANNVAGLYITHDLAVIKDISDRVAVMLRGDLVEEGPVSGVLELPQHEYTQMLMAAVPDPARPQ